MAALHFNENSNREQAKTKEGNECYDIVYPKFKKGGHTVKKVTVKQTYGECFFSCDVCINHYT